MADEMYTPEKTGAWRRIAAFLKRFWAVSLVVLVPLIPDFVEVWGMNNPFPAVPDIITEAEIGEISAYVDEWSGTYDQPVNWGKQFDLDGDGVNEVRVHGFRCPEPNRTELYVHTSMEIPGLWQLLTGKCGFAPQGEKLAVQDGRTALSITVSSETAGDRSEPRQAVEKTLAWVRAVRAGEAEEPPVTTVMDILEDRWEEASQVPKTEE